MRRAWIGVGILAAAAGCNDTTTQTGLNPEGPPMVRQVFMTERALNASGNPVARRDQLAFGDHIDIPGGDDRSVTQAVAQPDSTQPIRVILDELLVGNHLEELECADDSFSPVALGATPDDIARCSGPDLSNCTAVCVGIGIKDLNTDGAADGRRMRVYGDGELAVTIDCGGVNIPLDAELSFYNPSGNQQLGGSGDGVLRVDTLGPSLVLVPSQGIRTGVECGLAFQPAVVDRDGLAVCAPPNGDVAQDCAPGDTSAIRFTVEPLFVLGSDPDEGETEATESLISLQFNASIDAASVAGGVTLTENGVDRTADVTAMLAVGDATQIIIELAGGLAPGADYVLTVAPTITDIFGSALPEEHTLTFTTAAGDADAGVDAS
jgi:hypothetical protein